MAISDEDVGVLAAEPSHSIILVVAAGFEERAAGGLVALLKAGVTCRAVVVLRYGGEQHARSEATIETALAGAADQVRERRTLNAQDHEDLRRTVGEIIGDGDLCVCDVTGLSRINIFGVLEALSRSTARLRILYTEAVAYHPLRHEVEQLLVGDPIDRFFRLTEYERSDLLHSSACDIKVMPGFGGLITPNFPLCLIGFLTFKRSRLACILNAVECQMKILVEGVPERDDLLWRIELTEAINFDIVEANSTRVVRLPTFDAIKTHSFLREILVSDERLFWSNFILAPLGSKMQTLGCWALARQFPNVRVVSATPREMFPDKYSIGIATTHLTETTSDMFGEL